MKKLSSSEIRNMFLELFQSKMVIASNHLPHLFQLTMLHFFGLIAALRH